MMKIFAIVSLVLMLGLTACQKRDTDTKEQDKLQRHIPWIKISKKMLAKWWAFSRVKMV